MNLDQGTEVSFVSFRNASKTGLVIHENLGSTQHGNIFDLPEGVCQVTTLPWSADVSCPP
ncbi:hypothetical protein [Haliangium ochraceum]|uniref:Uncharacterized protein n=1 Tax=Haliangium ochraceum (strain DSM 14365 / JCM 11303 / SMP-2) TaxID=502025 RepID=D0LY27_HALO1|nr:hypothetical protein [Haliangium ochraceum]ACY14382.1 hypothetical protein Hoch_1834 [Haliangium ochraceum DSM 14365]